MSRIEHLGTVKSHEDGYYYILIEQQTACSTCHAKGYCNPAEKGRDIVVKVADRGDLDIKKGEKIKLFISKSNGLWAVALAYLIPVIICLFTLIILIELGISEPTSALITVGFIVIYFVFFLIFGQKFERKIDISIEKIL